MSWPPPWSFTPILAIGVGVAGLWAWRAVNGGSLEARLAAGALLTLVFFLLAKQAFLNYYFLSASTLAIAIGCTGRRGDPTPPVLAF